MTTSQLIASLVGSLAWPAAVVVIAVGFRRPIGQLLLGHLRRLKAGPFEADFDLIASQVQAKVDQPIMVRGKLGRGTGHESRDWAGKASAAVVIEAYGEIERQLLDVITQAGSRKGDELPRSAAALARLAGSEGLIRPETVNAVEGVTVLRNLAVHRDDVTEEQAEEYLTLVDAVCFAIQQDVRSHQQRAVATD